MKTLYVSDLDGTLLNCEARLNPHTITTINELVTRGMHFTYATARSFSSASKITAGLTLRVPVISCNGAFLVDPCTRERLLTLAFTEDEVCTVQTLMSTYDVSPFVYTFVGESEQVRWITGQENAGSLHYIHNRDVDKRMTPLTAPASLYAGTPFYFTCIGKQRELHPLYQALKADPRFQCTLQQEIYRTEYWLEIMPAQATKANAIQTLCTLQHYDRVVCFGDAINDLPMFSIADECYAVANAVPELQTAATAVIGSNVDDSVARWLFNHAQFN